MVAIAVVRAHPPDGGDDALEPSGGGYADGDVVTVAAGEIDVAAEGETAVEGAIVGDTEGGVVGLGTTSVSTSRASIDSAGTNRTTPAPSGGTETTEHPVPVAPAGVQVSADRSPTVTSTLM